MSISDGSFLNKETKEQLFWDWFKEMSSDYFEFEKDQEALSDLLLEKLHEVQEGLVFEFSPVFENGTRELVISADGIKDHFPAVEALVDVAPQIPGFTIVAFRQAMKDFCEHYGAVSFGDIELRTENMFFRYANDDHKIGLELNIRGFEDGNIQHIQLMYLVLDALIGEYDVEMHISWIDKKVLDESQLDKLFPIEKLLELMAAKKLEWQN